jgi:hypothetical protein
MVVFWIYEIEQMVTDFVLHCRCRLGGSDIEIAIYLHRIDRNDLAFVPLGHLDGDRRFTGRRRAKYGNGSQETTLPTR